MKIVNVIRNLVLQMCNFRGQGADGAGNMTAKKKCTIQNFKAEW